MDLFFRSPSDAEYREHRDLVYDAVEMLCKSESKSMIAKRGVTILGLLLRKEQHSRQRQSDARDGSASSDRENVSSDQHIRDLDIPKFIQSFCEQDSSKLSGAASRGKSGGQHRPPAEGLHASSVDEANTDNRNNVTNMSSPSFLELLGDLMGPQQRFSNPNGSWEDILFSCGQL